MRVRGTAIASITVLAFALLGAGRGVALAQGNAGAEPAPKWGAHTDIEAKMGSKRSLAEVDVFAPLAQDERTLLFGDFRARVDDNGSREGNIGLGVRRMLEGGWNLGGYGYFDRLRSDSGNYFNQVTLGAEALGRDWDLRGNAYLPSGNRVRDAGSTATAGASTAVLSGSVVQIITPTITTTTRDERTLRGYDAELGWRTPLFEVEDRRQLRVYLGGYRFSDSTMTVSGPRARVEFTMAEVPQLWQGAQLTLSAETQHDDARGSQTFLGVRLRIPFGGEKETSRRMNYQERRMTAPVVRDVDIVTQARAVATTTPGSVETAINPLNGQPLQSAVVLDSTTTTGAALPAAVSGAGANSFVILSGSFTTTASTALASGQTVMGGGSALMVRNAAGRTASFTAPGSPAAINGVAAVPSVTMANNSVLTGMTISYYRPSVLPGVGTPIGVDVSGVTGATIANNTINVANNCCLFNGVAAVRIQAGASNITVSGNTITSNNDFGNAFGLQIDNSSATVAGNTLSASGHLVGPTLNYAVRLDTANILPGSSGNKINAGTCGSFGAPSGSAITFTNAGSCP